MQSANLSIKLINDSSALAGAMAVRGKTTYRSACGLKNVPRRMDGRWFLWSLVLGALLFAQTLGLIHSLAHAQHAGEGQEIEWRHLHGDEAIGQHSEGWLDKLFASHEEEGSQCRVFDHQSHSALMPSVAALALPSVLQAFVVAVWVSCRPATSAASFDARGPPFPH
jgi:hypothetical protein